MTTAYATIVKLKRYGNERGVKALRDVTCCGGVIKGNGCPASLAIVRLPRRAERYVDIGSAGRCEAPSFVCGIDIVSAFLAASVLRVVL